MKAALTAWAWRTPWGSGAGEVLEHLLAGHRAAVPHRHLDGAPFPVALGCPLPAPPRPFRQQRFLRRMGLHALECGLEALGRSGAAPGPRLGVFLAYGGLRVHWNDMMPALREQLEDGRQGWERGLRLFHPFWMLQHLSNNAQALLAMEAGAKGEGLTCGGANAGAQALAAAQRALASGTLDAALVVAHDTLLEPETLVDLGSRRHGAAQGTQPPPPPYLPGSRGFLPGEAAAALVLEHPCQARDRAQACIHAADAADGGREAPGPGALRAVLARVLAPAGEVEPPPPAMLDGASQAWPELDTRELDCAGALLPAGTPLCALQASLGQLGAAAPLVQAIALSLLLREGLIPPLPGAADPGSPSISVEGTLLPSFQVRRTSLRRAIALSAGAPGLAGALSVEVP